MIIKLTNSMTGRKEQFVPGDPSRITLYVCGPTTYDRAHIGNFRPLIVFDTLFRLLRQIYGVEHVLYASNITDIDDKIIAKAAKDQTSPAQLAAKYADLYLQDAAALNALEPSFRPRATGYIPEMIAMMQQLEQKNIAYKSPSGLVFNIDAVSDYGKLSHRRREDMLAGARIEPDATKRNPGDFYLWKTATDHAVWDSPWGKGRPGWHSECAAMCAKTLGTTIDIHGGGMDLQFPHHENELAQHESIHGAPMARYWLHNGYVNRADEKMSKSLGNTLTLPELTRSHAPETIRLALLSAHYRKPLEWSNSLLQNCRNRLNRLYEALEQAENRHSQNTMPDNAVMAALADDLNTPLALSALSELARSGADKDSLLASGNMLGLLQQSPEQWRADNAPPPPEAGEIAQIETLLAQRSKARAEKDWDKADHIRKQLEAKGISISDTSTGVKWQRVN